MSATAQTVLGQNNYEGNRVIDPLLAGSVTALRETPRNLQLPDWAITAAALQGVGYDFGGANPHAVNGPTNDYMGDVRGSPPDIGHDEQ